MEKNNLYPKVLIVNQQSMRKNNATGITLRSLWGGWDTSCLMEIYTDEYETKIDNVPDYDSFLIRPHSICKLAHSGMASKVNSKLKIEKRGLCKRAKSQIRQAAVLFLDMLSIPISDTVEDKIRSFKPDVIYTLGASVSTLDLAYKLSVQFQIPIVIHYMDNWPESIQWENNFFNIIYRPILNRKLKLCLSRGTEGLAISPQMASAYQKKFKMHFSSIMNCINIDEYHLRNKPVQSMTASFIYAGGLHLNRWKALAEIANAIADTGTSGVLHIYTSKDNVALYKSYFPSNVVFHDYVDHSKIIEVYESADVLVHAEVPNPLLQGFFRYSISTKIPEYLASGRIMLFYGPKEMGLYKYLHDNNAAFLASNYTELCSTIKCVFNPDIKGIVLKNAEDLTRKNHDITVSRHRLIESIRRAVTDSMLN